MLASCSCSCFVVSVSLFRDKPSVGPSADVFNDEMLTDEVESAARQHDDTLGELGLILLQNNVCPSTLSLLTL